MILDEQNRLAKPFSINQLLVLSALRSNKKLTLAELIDITYIHESKARSALEGLVEIGLVEYIGSSRTKSYMLSAKVYRASNNAIAYVHQSGINKIKYPELIIKLIKTQGYVRLKDVEELLNITPTQARSQIKQMIASGKIKKTGKARNTQYELV